MWAPALKKTRNRRQRTLRHDDEGHSNQRNHGESDACFSHLRSEVVARQLRIGTLAETQSICGEKQPLGREQPGRLSIDELVLELL